MTNLDYTTLRVRGALDITRLTGFTLHVGVNDHAHAVVEGEAGGDAFEQIRRSLAGREMALLALDEDGEERPIFTGVVAKAALMGLGQYPRFRVELLSGTSLLDHEKRKRSFQDVDMTFEQLALQVVSEHPGGAAICTVGERERLGRPVIQYRETDWEFLKRMASRCGGVVVPETRYGMPRIWFGFPDRSYPCSFPEDKYSVGYSPRFWELGGEMMGYSRADFLYYDVESGQNCDLGWHTTFKGHDLLVMEKWAKLERGELRFTYRLGRPGLGWGRTIYNERIRGMSLLGEVLETERETLKLRLDIDEGRDPGGAYAYDWRPETGNMMYCMPQVGTRVSLYFPDHDEQHAMAVNCVRTNGGSCDRMSDPSKRAFVTEHGKELTLYPDRMALSGAGGKISLVDDRGLDIISERGIIIIGRSVKFEAPTVSIIAEQSELMLAKGDTAALFKNPETWVPDTGFLVSHQFDLLSRGFTHVDGWNRIKHDPYTDQPQEGNFWGDLLVGVLAAVVKIAVVVAAVAVASALGPVGLVWAAMAAGAVAGGLAGFAYAIKSGKSIGEALAYGVCGAVVGATVGFLGGAVAALAPATVLGVSTEAWATLAICGTSMQWGEKIGKGEEMTVGSMLLDAGVNTFLAPFFLNPATQIPALWVSGIFCTGSFGYACYIGDGEMAGESLVGAVASFGTIAYKGWKANQIAKQQAALEAAKQQAIEKPAERPALEESVTKYTEDALNNTQRYTGEASEGWTDNVKPIEGQPAGDVGTTAGGTYDLPEGAAKAVGEGGNRSASDIDRIMEVAQRSYDYAVENPRQQGLNRMQLGKDAEVQATRWVRKWAEKNGIGLGEDGLHFQVRGDHSIPDMVYEPAKTIIDFKLTPKAVRKNQSDNFANDFLGYIIRYIFGPGPWRGS